MAPRVPRSAPVLVTGCSSGIGRATVAKVLAGGRTTYATARQVDTLAALASAGARVLPLDVTDEQSMTDAVLRIEDETGPVGALVNNAGYGEYGPVEELPLDAVRRQFETNVFGLLRMTQLVLPGMRARGSGRIVNVSSMGGRMTLPGGGAYHASKYAVEALTDALRFETRGFGVGVCLVEPGPVHTPFGVAATAGPAGDGPYADFVRGVAARNAATYDNPSSPGTSSAEDVGAVIASAIEARRPRARYLVGGVSRALVWGHRLLPTPLWDAALRTSYPTPHPQRPS
jgi:NAD(P)-dependent dehydrogenase (short-subunit alcohol dehydrogenase family)